MYYLSFSKKEYYNKIHQLLRIIDDIKAGKSPGSSQGGVYSVSSGKTLIPIFITLCQLGDNYRKRSFMYKRTDTLCEEAKLIREEVFEKEQGFLDEFDEIDEIAKHLVFYMKRVVLKHMENHIWRTL